MNKHLRHLEVRWKNFKGYQDTGWVKIKPLTILLGSNNCGKSSFLAPFLLMNQTLNSRDRYSPLILKGDYYNGGNYQEIVKDYRTENDIFLGFKYHIHDEDGDLGPIGEYPPGAFEFEIGVPEKEGEIMLKKLSVYDLYYRQMLSLTANSKTGKFAYKGLGSSSFSPKERAAIMDSQPLNFLLTPNSILDKLRQKNKGKRNSSTQNEENIEGKVEQFSEGFSQLLTSLSWTNGEARRWIGELSFVGPLRDKPHRIYEIANEVYKTVGVNGEHFPNLIRNIGSKENELNSWVKRFGFGDQVELVKNHSNTYSLRFTTKGSHLYTSIANAGFGASQVLPLIVQALVASKQSITIAEQPEIHLNPKVQGVLAELFVEMAKNKKTVIFETHSEHIVLRIRSLMAEGKISADDVALYFVEKDGDTSLIREIAIEDNGHIQNDEWPKDFMQDTLRESFNLAAQQAKRRRKDV